jgi:2-methylcitrate dehydratase PrpD
MEVSVANSVKPSLLYLAASRLKIISHGQLSAEVRQKASLCLIDFLGAAQIGLQSPLARSILEFTVLHDGKPEAYVFGGDSAICAETAAFANTILAHR